MDHFDEYLPANYVPNIKSSRELYPAMMEELAYPFPSTKTYDFKTLDKITNGFRAREYSIICGATGIGKTCFLANLSAAWMRNKVSHFVASVETGPTDFLKRIASILERKNINNGNPVDVNTLKKIHIEHGGIFQSETLQLSLYDNRFKVEQLMADITWAVKHKGIKIAMIDNLNFFMEVTKAADQIVEMDRVIHELIIFCKRIDVHVLMVQHPKKTDHGRVENEFDIKGSSTAVQEAHNIFLFNKVKLDHPDYKSSDRELKIQKMRRNGMDVGKALIFSCDDGVSYREDRLVEYRK